MEEMDRATILEGLRKMTAVQIADWVEKEGESFGPLVRGGRGTRYDIEQAAGFVTELLEGKVMHYDGGREEAEFHSNLAVLEIYGQSGLRRKYVIVKDGETEEYVCYLSWLM
ncbi:MAG: hypothetical protein LN413_02885 [Candidatus Thermoplasmatota archaeon]|nr:hypothetical protein [Candidatus Thermoplasmatota archaeon]